MIKFDHFAERGPLRRVRQALNDMREEIKSLRIANGIGYTVKRTAIGQVLHVKPGAGSTIIGDVEVQRFSITAQGDDWVTAHKVGIDDTIQTGITFYIRKPETLQVTHQGQMPPGYVAGSATTLSTGHRSFSITATVNGETKTFEVNQTILPAYANDDQIYAVKGIDGGTKLLPSDGTTRCDWLDLNVDARRWVLDEQFVEVCVNGVTKYMMIRASEVAD